MYICQNHIRTFQKIPSSSNRLLVCGTQGDQTPQCVAVDVSSPSIRDVVIIIKLTNLEKEFSELLISAAAYLYI